jgi:hypothetical protein
MFVLWKNKVLKKLLDDFLCWIGYYPPTVVEARKKVLESDKIYKSAIKKAKPASKNNVWPADFKTEDVVKALDKQAPKPAAKKTTTRRTTVATKPGLYANIHAKRERIERQKAEGKPVETMRKAGSKGAPTAKNFKEAAKTAKGKK